MSVCGVDHQQVDARLGEAARLRPDVTVDPHRRGDPQPAVVVNGGRVDARPDRSGTGEHPGQRAVGLGQHRHVDRRVFEQVEHLPWIGACRCGDEVGHGDVADPGEPVHSHTPGLGDQADRPSLEEHHSGAVGALVNQRRRIGHRVVGGEHDRGVDDEVTALDEVDSLLHRRDRKILRKNDNATATCDRFSHPPTRDRGHVGNHHRDGRARAVRRREVDVHPGHHIGASRDDEDVVVGQVVGGLVAVEEFHLSPILVGSFHRQGPREAGE